MLQWVENALIHNGVFVRNRKSNRVRALGITMYHMGLSLRDTSTILGYFGGASHEAIRNWYGRCKDIFTVKSRKRRAIAIDETKIKIQGKWMFIWAAIDIDSWEVIATWVSQGRSCFEALQFIRRVLSLCKNKPLVYVDRARWYKWALNRLGVPWEHKTFGPRNPIEQWFGILKHRIKRFYKRWPHNANIEHVNDWVKSFTCCYHIKKTGGALC
jgi:putative transposase